MFVSPESIRETENEEPNTAGERRRTRQSGASIRGRAQGPRRGGSISPQRGVASSLSQGGQVWGPRLGGRRLRGLLLDTGG